MNILSFTIWSLTKYCFVLIRFVCALSCSSFSSSNITVGFVISNPKSANKRLSHIASLRASDNEMNFVSAVELATNDCFLHVVFSWYSVICPVGIRICKEFVLVDFATQLQFVEDDALQIFQQTLQLPVLFGWFGYFSWQDWYGSGYIRACIINFSMYGNSSIQIGRN